MPDSLGKATEKLYTSLGKEIQRRAKLTKERPGQPDGTARSVHWGGKKPAELAAWTQASAAKAAELVATGDLEQINGWSWTG